MTREPLDIVAVFNDAAFEVEGRKIEGLTLDSKFSDLQLDSVAVMEIIGSLEKRLEVRFDDEALLRVTTLRDLQALIERVRGESEGEGKA